MNILNQSVGAIKNRGIRPEKLLKQYKRIKKLSLSNNQIGTNILELNH